MTAQAIRNYLTLLVIFGTAVSLVGCGGGGGASGGSSSIEDPARSSTGGALYRSVRLNTYNTWSFRASDPAKEQDTLSMIANRENVCFTECGGWKGVTPQAIRAVNPSARVYRLYDLCIKPAWDSDWNNPSDTTGLQTPLTRQMIEANDWWLRDGNDEIVKDENGWFIDVGKPGVKEEYLKNVLQRNQGKGFDGMVFDYWIDNLYVLKGKPRPKAYPTDKDWAEKAWKPLLNHVITGLRNAGYRVIGNCAGEYGTTNPEKAWQRNLLDGTVYEQWAVGWNGEWLPGSTIERRIAAFRDDPLEAWCADFGLRSSDSDYSRKALVGLAMYYAAVPQDQSRRSFNYYGDMKVQWDPLWNFYIGQPAGSATKMSGKYFWGRKFTLGLVLLNYEGKESITYTLDRAYKDSAGKSHTGKISVPAYSAVILTCSQP